MNSDVRSTRWHPSFIRYAEFDGVSIVLHHSPETNHDKYRVCLLRSNIPDDCMFTDAHIRESYTRGADTSQGFTDLESAEEAFEWESEHLRQLGEQG